MINLPSLIARNKPLRKFLRNKNNNSSRFYKKESKSYYTNLDLKNITDNKRFWKTMKPFLIDNVQKITLIENEEILSSDVDVAETLNSFF